VLAGGGGRPDDLQVPVVRRGDGDGLDRRVGDDLPPVGGAAREAEALLRGARAIALLVGADDESGPDALVEEAVAGGAQAAAMHRAHPAHTDHPDADRPLHRISPFPLANWLALAAGGSMLPLPRFAKQG
jgi:hypothetical protein